VPARRVDPLNLPQYTLVANVAPHLVDYLRNLTGNLQAWADQVQQATDNGLLPTQVVTTSQVVSASATIQNETFVPALVTGTNYGVIITPSWLTTYAVVSKTTTGFSILFGTAATASVGAVTPTLDIAVWLTSLPA
jgi:hypothetical protein